MKNSIAHTVAVLNATLDSTRDAIVAVDMNGTITTSNDPFIEMWQVRPEHLRDSYTLKQHIASQLTDPEAFLAKAEATRVSPETEAHGIFTTKDGRTVERSVSPQRIDGHCVGVVVNWRDISGQQQADTDRAALLERERLARVEAERANQLKDDFLATLSHELRTPLSTILGWAHILKIQAHDPEKAAHAADVIQQNARAQVQLINDLLDMSRIVSGKLRLDLQPVSLPAVMEAALETMRPSAMARDISLVEELDPVIQPVDGDPARLQQILWNLLSNAIKFTPKGGEVQVRLASVDSHAVISVSDTGAGIDPALLPHVFERFRQGNSSASREHGGLGIGLSIVKTLVELHGGNVGVESEGAGRGATFSVALPLAATIHPRRPDRQPRDLGELLEDEEGVQRLDGLRVLVVDDQEHTLEAIGQILVDAGATVATASSVATALQSFSAAPPDILLSDIAMPQQDGYDLIRQVRASSQVPAAALTAFARSEDRTRALRAGYDAHLSKPVEPGELIATLASLAQRRR